MGIYMPLTQAEFFEAASIGTWREANNVTKKKKHRYGFDHQTSEWENHIYGACSEKLVARTLGLYWQGFLSGKDKGVDIGKNIQVRSTQRPTGCLIVHNPDQGDNPDFIYVLVVGIAPNIEIAGWMYGRDAQQTKYWRTDTGREAYFVPQKDLNKSIEELKAVAK